MKLPGYWVVREAENIALIRTTFDDTELDPASDWKRAWQNQQRDGLVHGYVDWTAALIAAANALATRAGRSLSPDDLDQLSRFVPHWQGDRCDFPSLESLLESHAS